MPNILGVSVAGKIEYGSRGLNPPMDWTQLTLTLDDDWHDLDCSAIVPAGAQLIDFAMIIQSDDLGDFIHIKHPNSLGGLDTGLVWQQAAGIQNFNTFLLPCPADRMMNYSGLLNGNGGIIVSIRGWIF